jgi:hypothetical protein
MMLNTCLAIAFAVCIFLVLVALTVNVLYEFEGSPPKWVDRLFFFSLVALLWLGGVWAALDTYGKLVGGR